MKNKKIVILGSTGSIGRNVLRVAAQFPDRFEVVGLTGGWNTGLLKEQVHAFNPGLISVADDQAASQLADMLPPVYKNRIVAGQEGNKLVASLPEADMVVSAIVGAAGLLPTFEAIKAGKDIALANKETLVMAGRLVMEEVQKKQVRLLPIDSEHSAIAQALEAGRKEDVARIILTASGGPFLNLDAESLWRVTPEQALNHPNWDMGQKISIDSATLMNKGLEVIEARWLFDVELAKIEVLVHPQRLSQLNLAECRDLSFLKPDTTRFPALQTAYEACRLGGCKPAVLNAANEVAVAAFLEGKIKFPEIARVVEETVENADLLDDTNIDTILEADRLARIESGAIVQRFAES